MEQYERTKMLIGERGIKKLKNSKVIVFGVGGVGSYAVEALARAGVGKITLVDNDTVSRSNINRQLVALHSTIGINKTTVAKSRISDIDKDIQVEEIIKFYLPENSDEFNLSQYDYIIDAIDTITAKLDIADKAYKNNLRLISSMGTGNKLHPEKFQIDDIKNTSVCPLCRVIRSECKKRGIQKLKVLYSTEQPIKTETRIPGSISFVPSVAGLLIAGEVIRELLEE